MADMIGIILAAGKGTRMKSKLPKALHPICGKPMTRYVIDACKESGIETVVVVIGHGADQVREGMREGESFAGRLKETGVFPPLLTHMVGVGEETGDLQGTLITVANSYDVEVDASLKSLVSLLEPLIIITVGSTIAFIIMAMLLPVFQLNLTSGG